MVFTIQEEDTTQASIVAPLIRPDTEAEVEVEVAGYLRIVTGLWFLISQRSRRMPSLTLPRIVRPLRGL